MWTRLHARMLVNPGAVVEKTSLGPQSSTNEVYKRDKNKRKKKTRGMGKKGFL